MTDKKRPLVSVITPAYNAEKYITSTIESVQLQSFSDWEMIIVDDCSDDQTFSIVQEYAQKDSRIRLIALSENGGAAISRNTAIRASRGRYLAFLDSDDQWLPDKLTRQLEFMRENKEAFTFTAYRVVDEVGNKTGKTIEAPEKVTYRDLLKENMIGCLTVMIDTEQTGPLEMVNIRTRQDYVLWLELCKKGFPPTGINEVYSLYRVTKNSVSSNKVKMVKQNWRVYRDIERLNFARSLWYFSHFVLLKIRKYLT
ncbi:glycosyltransferase family 2 protein [Alteribacter natronophilus]|uniref:glycosyltransferase family 2 protein n=1 Tax=Alteribacter natronophilus TaxID=2583810 RepID=UPI00110DF5E9|nr:glycosyltransferase family 2 protein [Alteribacter natronophilus]TMW72347.1 glycosyltransferase family 2 protein [Alteribacter natronophilus]